MRIPLNLASEPFRRDRPVLVGSIVAGVLLTAALAILVSLAVLERNAAAATRREIATLEREASALAAEQSRLESFLRRPDNAAVLDYVAFLNSLLYRKGISWTRLFADLESVLPYNVRLVSVRPQVGRSNEVLLEMVVGAESPAPIIELLKRLESSPLFGSVDLHNTAPPGQSDPLYRSRVTVRYAGGA